MQVDYECLGRLGWYLALVAALVLLGHVPDGQDEAASVLERAGGEPLVGREHVRTHRQNVNITMADPGDLFGIFLKKISRFLTTIVRRKQRRTEKFLYDGTARLYSRHKYKAAIQLEAGFLFKWTSYVKKSTLFKMQNAYFNNDKHWNPEIQGNSYPFARALLAKLPWKKETSYRSFLANQLISKKYLPSPFFYFINGSPTLRIFFVQFEIHRKKLFRAQKPIFCISSSISWTWIKYEFLPTRIVFNPLTYDARII